MDGPPGLDVLKLRTAMAAVLLLVFYGNLTLSSSLNDEGLALLRIRDRVFRDPFGALANWNGDEEQLDPCSWFGVECSDGKVVILNLKDLCLGGTLAPEIGELTHVKSIILRNNSFHGDIPREITGLEELEVLDLGYNNFSGPFPSELGNNLSLTVLLLDNNEFINGISPELYELKMLSEYMADERQLAADEGRSSCKMDCNSCGHLGKVAHQRRLLTDANSLSLKAISQAAELQTFSPSPSPSSSSPISSPVSSPSSFLSPQSNSTAQSPQPTLTPGSANPPHNTPVLHNPERVPSPASPPTEEFEESRQSKNHTFHILVGVISGSAIFALIAAVAIVFFRSSQVIAVKPWSTGLSGQLQKAFVSGVPKLNRSELEGACEDFSNIIDSFSGFTVYKGTLSSGVEIAVSTIAKAAIQDWSKNKETRFRTKIETLSRVNHKNFVNLIGYCEEEQPLTRMMVFEYAPNGTLFEHLHIKEAEHLDWGMRVRIAMGMSFCLEYMHQLNPPVHHTNLLSSAVYLTDDYAAKISDLSCWEEEVTMTKKMGSVATEPMQTQLADSESNIHSFGLILLEMLTGRVPYCLPDGPLASWVSDFLEGDRLLSEMVDPTLNSFNELEFANFLAVIKQCVLAEPGEKPTMKEITVRLKEITAMEADAATPKTSPLWWAELEILSTEAI